MKSVRYAGRINVFYTSELDGGGMSFGQDYLKLIRSINKTKPINRVLDFCSGAGFIGFSLLAHRFCHSLCLIDYYEPAIAMCNLTIRENSLSDHVIAYHSRGLQSVPLSERFDLVVANPPHFSAPVQKYGLGPFERIYVDADWYTHRDFYMNIPAHLNEGGSILIQEHAQGSHPETFRKMIQDGGLQITAVYSDQLLPKGCDTNYYYLYIERAKK